MTLNDLFRVTNKNIRQLLFDKAKRPRRKPSKFTGYLSEIILAESIMKGKYSILKKMNMKTACLESSSFLDTVTMLRTYLPNL